MRRVSTVLIVTAVCVSTGAALAAQAPTSSAIEALVQRAMTSSPVMAEVRAGVEVARGDRLQAGLRPNPSAAVERLEQSGGRETRTSVGLVVPLDLFRRGPRVAVAEREVQMAELEVEAVAVERAFLIRRQAATVLAARRLVSVLENESTAMRSRVDLLTARVEAGAGRPLDRDLALVEWRRADAERRRQEGEAGAALAELAALVGVSPADDLGLTRSLEEEVAAVKAPAEDAEIRRPDLRQRAVSVGKAEAERASATAEGRWDLQVSATYMNRRMNGERAHEGAIGVMVDLPLRNRQQGAVAAARAREASARAALENARIAAAAEVAAARARLSAAEAVLEQYRGGWLETAASNLAVMREAWTLGDVTLLDVIEEERRFLMTQSEYTAALRDVIEARAMLRLALGGR